MKAKEVKETDEVLEGQDVQITGEDTEAVENKSDKTPKAKKKEPEISPKVDAILKKFAYLEKAYVSDKGGVYDVKTPEHIRGNAVLYTNPYFKH